jgi:hypothetical protein
MGGYFLEDAGFELAELFFPIGLKNISDGAT